MRRGRRWHYGAHDTTDDYRTIDVRRWQRDGFLTPGRTFGWQWTRHGEVTASIQVRVETDRLWLICRHQGGSGEWKDENYTVWFDRTACSLGGQRLWFRCPARGCNRHVAILYGGRYFRLSNLLSAGLSQPARNLGWSIPTAC